MTTTRTKIEQAAFWDLSICLDCGEPQTHEGEDDAPELCHECNSPDVREAADLLSLLDKILPEDDS